MRARRAGRWCLAAAFLLTACGQGHSNGSSTPARSSPPIPVPSTSTSTDTSAAPQPVPDDWPTYHRDGARAGNAPSSRQAGRLTSAFTRQLDGAVYAEPIVVQDRLIVATENNTVYAFDAATGTLRWQRHLATPVPRSALSCGNIDPEGITSTPAYDASTHRVFVVAEQQPGVRHDLYGVDLTSGNVTLHRSADPPNQSATSMQERAALLVAHGRVYWAYGGLAGDCGDYHGHVVSVPVTGAGAMTYYRVPTPREGGIWAPPGPVLAADGHIYVSVGNGESTTSYDGSDSVIELDANLERVSYFAPTTWSEDNKQDLDLGSLGPTLVGPNVFIAGKRGLGYLARQNALGGLGGELAAHPVCKAFGGTARIGSTVYVPCTDGVREVRVGSRDFTLGWQAARNITGSPVAGRGAVWSLDPSGGTLYGLNPATGRVVASQPVGTTTRFATPTIWGDEVFVGTESGVVALKVS
ncbi:MAG: PQQ-binding-like beta-propeller repeat protein [Actinomycetes bacterium]